MEKHELIDLAIENLDMAVARCEHMYPSDVSDYEYYKNTTYSPSTKWSQGGEIIERVGVTVQKEGSTWSAYFRDRLFAEDGTEYFSTGDTPLIAAMRCYVASMIGQNSLTIL